MHTKVDHLVIGAANLSEGVEYVKHMLGVDIPFGGEHLKMGTHNHLMKLGDELFLEVLAINHNLPLPPRPRWYGLDDPLVRRQLNQGPCLLTWVVNTQDINQLMQRASFSLGKPELISRGSLSWNFGLPEDGRLLAGGILPYAIEWHTDAHPANAMAELGCQLEALELYHPCADWLRQSLDSINVLRQVNIFPLSNNEAPYLSATISTPSGTVILRN